MKNKCISFVIAFVCAAFLTSCYLGRTIDKPVNVYVDCTQMRVALVRHVQYTKYLQYRTEDEYRQEFKNALEKETTYSTNVTLVDSREKADYTLRVTYFEIAESETKQTVNDPKSSYNGQVYYLTEIDTKAEFNLLKRENKLDDYKAYADKEEKLKNNQTLGDLIFGTNKDNTEYRQKLMQDDVCVDLSQACGKRTWNLFTQKLAKKMK